MELGLDRWCQDFEEKEKGRCSRHLEEEYLSRGQLLAASWPGQHAGSPCIHSLALLYGESGHVYFLSQDALEFAVAGTRFLFLCKKEKNLSSFFCDLVFRFLFPSQKQNLNMESANARQGCLSSWRSSQQKKV